MRLTTRSRDFEIMSAMPDQSAQTPRCYTALDFDPRIDSCARVRIWLRPQASETRVASEIGSGNHEIPYVRRDAIELGAAFVLGLATVTSTWCAYEAKAWNARQINMMLIGARSNSRAIEEMTRTTGMVVIDVVAFMQFATARQSGDTGMERFVHARMRPDFAHAVDEWLGNAPAGSMPEGTPFQLASYELPQSSDEHARLRSAYAKRMEEAGRCNEISAAYILLTVLLSTSLFFMGIATRFELRSTRMWLFSIGTALWIGSALSASTLPVALHLVFPSNGPNDVKTGSAP
jgi:hypothetical protein